jgi:hypothetical protein
LGVFMAGVIGFGAGWIWVMRLADKDGMEWHMRLIPLMTIFYIVTNFERTFRPALLLVVGVLMCVSTLGIVAISDQIHVATSAGNASSVQEKVSKSLDSSPTLQGWNVTYELLQWKGEQAEADRLRKELGTLKGIDPASIQIEATGESVTVSYFTRVNDREPAYVIFKKLGYQIGRTSGGPVRSP